MSKDNKISLKMALGNVYFCAKYMFHVNKIVYILRFGIMILNILSTLLSAFFMAYILNQITGAGAERSEVVLTTLIFALSTFVLSLFKRFMNHQNDKQTERALQDIKLNFGKIVSQMQYSDVENPRIKDFIYLASSTDSFSKIINYFTDFISAIISVFTYSAMVLYVQPLILIFILIVVVIQTVVSELRIKNQHKWRSVQAPIFRKLNYFFNVLSRPQYGKEMRIDGLQPFFATKIEDYFENRCIPPMKQSVFDKNKLNFIADGSKVLQQVLIYILLAFEVVYHHMRIGDFTLYLTGANQLTTALTNVVDCISNILTSGIFAGDFRYCISLAREKQNMFGNEKLPSDEPPSIVFKDVSFKYPGTDTYVLKHVSFTVEPTESLSLVGINGSGKSTIVKLLCRFYMPTEGDIYINGVNTKDISPENYETLLSVVFQDYKLFSFTVRDNIVMGHDADEQRIGNSIEKSGLKYKIDGLGQGLDTFVNKDFKESGMEFSGGEGQKLAIARAFYKDAPIVVLDEPTAALDPIAEYDIYKRIYDLTKSKTSIFISHRLSSTKFTNKIAVLEDGVLREFGSHKELMNIENGIYRNMFHMQAQYYHD